MIRSIVFLPNHVDSQWMQVCAAYCTAHRYEIVAVVHRWRDAMRLMDDGLATVLVTGRPDHLPPDREPRIEVVTEHQPEPESSARRRPKRRLVRRQVT